MRGTTHRARRWAPIACQLLAGGAAADVTLIPICVEGQHDPDGHRVLEVLDGPRINGAGRIIFGYSYDDITGQSIGAWEEGTPSVLVPFGTMAPDLPPTIPPRPYFTTFGTTVQGDDGSFMFFSGIDGTDIDDSNDSGLWAAGSDGALHLAAWEGDQAAGLSDGLTYTRLTDSYPAMSDSGSGAFCAAAKDPDNGDLTWGLWSWSAGATYLVAAAGQEAPGTDRTFTYFFNCHVDIAGRVSFVGATTKDGKPQDGIWRSSEAGLVSLALPGDSIPDGSATFDGFNSTGGPPQGNRSGQLLQEVTLAGPGVSFPHDMGVYRLGDGPAVQVVRGGDPAPGFDSGAFLFEPGAVAINDAGLCVVKARTRTPDNVDSSGIWIGSGGSLTLVAREGDPAPGAEGWAFGDFRIDGNGVTVRLDSQGRVYFNQWIGKLGQLRSGVWAWDEAGGVRPVVVTGDTIEVAAGDIRLIESATLPPLDKQRGSASANDAGQVAVYAVLEDDERAAILAEVDAPGCVPDCDGNGLLNLFDFLCYVNLFNAGDPAADCTADGATDLFDFLCFVNAFNDGC